MDLSALGHEPKERVVEAHAEPEGSLNANPISDENIGDESANASPGNGGTDDRDLSYLGMSDGSIEEADDFDMNAWQRPLEELEVVNFSAPDQDRTDPRLEKTRQNLRKMDEMEQRLFGPDDFERLGSGQRSTTNAEADFVDPSDQDGTSQWQHQLEDFVNFGFEISIENNGEASFTDTAEDRHENIDRHSSPSTTLNFPTWDKLDHVSRAIILKELSEFFGSFQMACAGLSLEPTKVETFLAYHHAECQQALAWWENIDEWVAAGRAPDDCHSLEATGHIHVEQESVERACEFIELRNLDGITKAVRSWSGRTIPWPLNIDYSDFDPLRLSAELENSPNYDKFSSDGRVLTANAHPVDARRRLEDDSRVFIAFRATAREPWVGIRIRSILLPEDVTIVGPQGTKQLMLGGRYTIVYPDGEAIIQDHVMDEFLICANDLLSFENGELVRNRGKVRKQLQQGPGQITVEPADSGPSNKNKGKGVERITQNTPTRPSIIPEMAAPEMTMMGTGLPCDIQSKLPDDPPSRSIPHELPDAVLNRIDLENLLFTSSCLREMPENSTPNGQREETFDYPLRALPRPLPELSPGPSPIVMNSAIGGESERTMWAQARIIENPIDFWSSTGQNSQQARTAPGIADGFTIKRTSLLNEPATSLHPEPFHANTNIFGPPQKRKVVEIMTLANECSDRVLFQFRLPAGYRIISPSGYTMNFNSAELETSDDIRSGGVGGLYTVVRRANSAPSGPARLPMIPELDDYVDLRMNLPERMAVFRNHKLLPRLTAAGLHEISAVQTTGGDAVDLVCESGRYQIFNDMALAEAKGLLSNQQAAMDIDEPERPSDREWLEGEGADGGCQSHTVRRATRAGALETTRQDAAAEAARPEQEINTVQFDRKSSPGSRYDAMETPVMASVSSEAATIPWSVPTTIAPRRSSRLAATSIIGEQTGPTLIPMLRPSKGKGSSQKRQDPGASSGRRTSYPATSKPLQKSVLSQKRALRSSFSEEKNAGLESLSTKNEQSLASESIANRLRPREPSTTKTNAGTSAQAPTLGGRHIRKLRSSLEMPAPTQPPKRKIGRPRKYPPKAAATAKVDTKTKATSKGKLVLGERESPTFAFGRDEHATAIYGRRKHIANALTKDGELSSIKDKGTTTASDTTDGKAVDPNETSVEDQDMGEFDPDETGIEDEDDDEA